MLELILFETIITKYLFNLKLAVMDDYYNTCLIVLGSTAITSLAPVILLFFVPNIDNENSLKKLLSLAVGCLIGDAFLHMIPQIAQQSQHDQDHHHDDHDHHHHDHHHNHHHHHHEFDYKLYSVALFKTLFGIVVFIIAEAGFKFINSRYRNKKSSRAKKKKDDDHHHQHSHDLVYLFADWLHNFGDGIFLAISYTTNARLGLSTTIAILLHEIPHQLSDYIVLRRSCSKFQAIKFQAMTAVGAFLGATCSLLLGAYAKQAVDLILPVLAGGFIFIAVKLALKDLLPQVKLTNFRETIETMIYFSAGLFIMHGLTYFE